MKDEDPKPQGPEEAESDAGEEMVSLGAGIDFADPHSPLAPLYCRSVTVVVATLLALVFVLYTWAPLWHTDVWGHLRFGEVLVEEGHLPEHETFSGDYADQEAPYINFQWLTQTGGYLIYKLGVAASAGDEEHALGGGALLLASAFGAVTTLRLLVLLLAFRRLTGSTSSALLGLLLILITGRYHMHVARPQVVGELCLALLLLPLSRPELSRRALVAIPLVMVLWANAHGSFLVGFVVLGACVAGRALEVGRNAWRQASGRRGRAALNAAWHDPQGRRLALALVLALVAVALLNPHGPSLYWHSLTLGGHPNIPTMEEWKPLRVKNLQGWLFLATVLLLAVLVRFSPRPFTPTQVLLLLGFGEQALAHERMVIWWFSVFAWVAVPHLDALFRARLPMFLRGEDTPDLRKTIFAVLLVVVLLMWSAPAQWLLYGEAPVATRRLSSQTPLQALRYLRAQYEKDHGRLHRRVFTSETLGDFLLFHLRLDPPVRILCYTHVHLLKPEHWQDCLKVKQGDHTWPAILDRWQVDFVVLELDVYSAAAGGYSDLIEQIRASDRWEVVPEFEGKPVIVARRKAQGSKPRR